MKLGKCIPVQIVGTRSSRAFCRFGIFKSACMWPIGVDTEQRKQPLGGSELCMMPSTKSSFAKRPMHNSIVVLQRCIVYTRHITSHVGILFPAVLEFSRINHCDACVKLYSKFVSCSFFYYNAATSSVKLEGLIY